MSCEDSLFRVCFPHSPGTILPPISLPGLFRTMKEPRTRNLNLTMSPSSCALAGGVTECGACRLPRPSLWGPGSPQRPPVDPWVWLGHLFYSQNCLVIGSCDRGLAEAPAVQGTSPSVSQCHITHCPHSGFRSGHSLVFRRTEGRCQQPLPTERGYPGRAQ